MLATFELMMHSALRTDTSNANTFVMAQSPFNSEGQVIEILVKTAQLCIVVMKVPKLIAITIKGETSAVNLPLIKKYAETVPKSTKKMKKQQEKKRQKAVSKKDNKQKRHESVKAMWWLVLPHTSARCETSRDTC